MSIESDEIEKINLIGGVFDDVDIADDFAGDPIDFKYDKELDDQFGDDFDINAFFSDDSIVEKDIGIVEKTAATGNVYSFTMPKEDFETANGFLTIVFMTPAQKQWMIDHNGVTDEGPRSTEDFIEVISCASLAHPIYMMMPAGPFTVEDPNTTGLKTIYGSEYAYVDYARAISRGIVGGYELEDVVILDKYRNYNKEAVIVDVGGSNATIYVNTAAVRKNDVILCNGEYTTDFEQITEIGTKVSDINLDGYIPYLTFDFGYTWQTNTDGSTNHDGILERKGMSNSTDEGRAAVETYMNGLGTRYCSIHNMAAIYGQTLKMMRDMDGELYVMTGNATYPDVSGVTYSSINTPTDKPNPFL
jgi:hypothetical protein